MSDLAGWDSFYVIVGSAAGALIGLQFVVVTLIADRPHLRVAEAGAAFATPTVVLFRSSVAFVNAPPCSWQAITLPAVLCGLIGADGIAYTLIVSRLVRRQTVYQPEFEDWLVSCRAPSGSVPHTRGDAPRGSPPHARGLVWHWWGCAPVALHRHSQCLGCCHLSRIRQPTGHIWWMMNLKYSVK